MTDVNIIRIKNLLYSNIFTVKPTGNTLEFLTKKRKPDTENPQQSNIHIPMFNMNKHEKIIACLFQLHCLLMHKCNYPDLCVNVARFTYGFR